MKDRRGFFKSLALIGAAAVGCPGIFIPKFEPVKWTRLDETNRDSFFGKWTFITGLDPAFSDMSPKYDPIILYERDEIGRAHV